MSFGKMKTRIELVETVNAKDDEGFITKTDEIKASVRAYKEDRHGNEKWVNLSVFSTATALFRFRVIPHLKVTTDMMILCEEERYNILSVEDVRGRGMYLEVLAEKTEGSK